MTAFQMNYTDQWQENYPASYWQLESITLNTESGGSASIAFAGYESAATVGQRVIDEKEYTLTQAEYSSFEATLLSSLTGATTIKQAVDAVVYPFAQSILDVDTGTKDVNLNEIFTSFFANATIVT